MAELVPRLLKALQKQLPRAVELRHRLHAHPELGNQERRTRELLAEALGDRGRPLHHPQFLPSDQAVRAVAHAQAAGYAGSAGFLQYGRACHPRSPILSAAGYWRHSSWPGRAGIPSRSSPATPAERLAATCARRLEGIPR